MKGDAYKKLLKKQMTRREFLQIIGGSLIVLFGFANFTAALNRFTKPATSQANDTNNHGFGSRKFGK